MNRADLLYSCLRDGRPWTRRDIFERTGSYFLLNNAASELRARGVNVVWSRAGRLHVYQLANGSLTERVVGSEMYEEPFGSHPSLPIRLTAINASRSVSDSLTPSAPVPQPSCSTPRGAPSQGSAALHPRPTSAEQLSLLVAA